MSKQRVSTKPGSDAPATDLTPCAVGNWLQGGAVVMLSPEATLHQKVALAWSMAKEAATMAEAAVSVGDSDQAKNLSALVLERLEVLTRLLGDLGKQTAGWSEQESEA